MSALLDYGDTINDWSIKSALIQSGYRADDASRRSQLTCIIKQTITQYTEGIWRSKIPWDDF